MLSWLIKILRFEYPRCNNKINIVKCATLLIYFLNNCSNMMKFSALRLMMLQNVYNFVFLRNSDKYFFVIDWNYALISVRMIYISDLIITGATKFCLNPYNCNNLEKINFFRFNIYETIYNFTFFFSIQDKERILWLIKIRHCTSFFISWEIF